MSEPTSALTFEDLIVDVAEFLGIASYGSAGDEAAQTPTDAHDLALCKSIVNQGVRKFVADAPETGWRWLRPVASVTLWGSVSADSSRTVSGGAYDSGEDETTLTANTDVFYATMELHSILIDSTSYEIKQYNSATEIVVTGDASSVSTEQFSIEANGNYTLPATFSGQYTGAITYAAGTNQGVGLDWSNDATIRSWRQDVTDEQGDPFLAAVRLMSSGDPRRRWELMVYPQPDEAMVVEFPFDLHFDKLVTLSEVPPAPFSHDDTIRESCLAVAELDNDDQIGYHQQMYRTCLKNSYRVDRRSAPRRLGYFGNPSGIRRPGIKPFRDHIYQRPDVSVNL